MKLTLKRKTNNIDQFQHSNLYYVCLSNYNIVDINSNHSQVLRIDCDAPTTTEHTTNQTITSDPMTTQQTTRQKIKSDTTTDNSGNVEYSSITTTTYQQTTDSLQSTTT